MIGRMLLAFALVSSATLARAEVDRLPSALDQLVRTEAPGATSVAAAVRGTQPQTSFQVGLSAQSCYILGTVGVASARRVSITLLAPDGKRVAQAKPRASSTSLRYCASWTGPFQVQAHAEGTGAYLTGVYTLSSVATPPPLVGAAATPPPVVAPPGPPPVVAPPRVVAVSAYPPPPPHPPETIYVAPTPVYIVPRVVVAPRGQASCNSSIDCGPGEFCKETGYGDRVCMGNGRHGDNCSSSIDCGPGGFCKEDSDGVRVCMSKGGRGTPCSSSIDCGFGLFCKDRGDDYMVCM